MQSLQKIIIRARQGILRTREFLQTATGIRLKRLLGLIFVVLSVGFWAATLIFSWGQLRPHLDQIDLWSVFVGFLATLVTFFLGGVLWGAVERGFGLELGWRQSMFIHLVSNVTKYMPGYAWQYVSKGYLSRAQENGARQISLAIFTEFALLISSGVMAASVVAGFFGTAWQAGEWQLPPWIWWPVVVLTAGVTVGWILYVPRWLGHPEAGRSHGSSIPQQRGRIDKTWLLVAWLVGVASWMLFSTAVWFFVRSLYPVSLALFPQCAIALVGASIISILIIFVPNGIGVRESAMALLLLGVVPLPIGIVVSILVRLGVVASEAVGLFLLLPSLRSILQRVEPSLPK